MQTFNTIIPFLLSLLVMVNVPTLPTALVFFIMSFTAKDEEKKKEYRKISSYLFIPLWISIFIVIIWGSIALITSL